MSVPTEATSVASPPNLGQILDAPPSRYALLEHLARTPEGAQVAELSQQLPFSAATIRRQLHHLVEIGAVTTNADPYFPMQGQRPTYKLERTRFLEALRALADTLQVIIVDDAQQLPLNQRLILTVEELRSLLHRN